MLTYTTLPLLGLIALLWRLTAGNVLAVVAFTAIFNAASALNVNNQGVAPWLVSLVLCLLVKALTGHVRWKIIRGANRPALNLILVFLGYAGLSGIVLPILFHGVQVMRASELIPLSLSMANVSQLCYLGAAALIFLLAVTSTRKEINAVMRWYVAGCITAALIGIYQLANAIFHVPYPSAVLYSNPGHVIFHAYKIAGMWRLNSTFTEASDMAGSLIGGLGIVLWDLMTRPARLWRIGSAALLLFVILMSLSTTGYVCLGLMFVTMLVVSARRAFTTQGMGQVTALIFLTSILIGTIVFTTSGTARNSVMQVASMVLLDKDQSDSYHLRTQTQGEAFRTLKNTDYLGAGWGSVRASGTGHTLLGSVGVLGLTLFSLGCIAPFLPLLRRKGAREAGDDLLQRSLFALLLLLASMMIAGSEPIAPMLWILFGTAIVASAPMEGSSCMVAGGVPAGRESIAA